MNEGDGTRGYVDGDALHSKISCPFGITNDKNGNIYVTEISHNRIRKISPTGVVTTVAGDGTPGYKDGNGTQAKFYIPRGITIDKKGNIFIADSGNHRIRKISANGDVTTIAGNGERGYQDGDAKKATFYYPSGVALDQDGNIYIADTVNHKIRKLSTLGVVTTVAAIQGMGNVNSEMENF